MRRIHCACVSAVLFMGTAGSLSAQIGPPAWSPSRMAVEQTAPVPRSAEYERVQSRLARGWNTWDVNRVATQVLLPAGLAIHIGMKHNTTLNGDAFLGDTLIGRQTQGAEVVTPGPHAWDGSYTELQIEWKGHKWRVQSAHENDDEVILVTPLSANPSALPPTVVFTVDYLWNRPGMVTRLADRIEASSSGSAARPIAVYCTSSAGKNKILEHPGGGAYFAADLIGPVGVSTGRPRSIDEIGRAIAR